MLTGTSFASFAYYGRYFPGTREKSAAVLSRGAQARGRCRSRTQPRRGERLRGLFRPSGAEIVSKENPGLAPGATLCRRSAASSELHHSDAVVFAIADVKGAALNEDAVRPGQLACERIPVGAIAALAGTNHGRDLSIPQIDSANNVTFRVGYVNSALRGVRNAFGPIQFCRHRRATVARISHFAGSCQ